MPAMLDDPTAPAIYRVSGEEPYPVPFGPLPPEIEVRQVTLRDRITIATLIPFSSPDQVPPRLSAFLCELLNREIEKGDTYPMMNPMALSSFAPYWFANFGAAMIMGDVQGIEDLSQMEERGVDWSRECLGSFYIKPNYPGRSSHVCNAGFLVSDAARNRGVGRLMGECYLEWAPKLGYTYSVFNLVYETNVASLRIWDALGFKRIGRVKGCGNLRSYPDQFIDAIIFGRELGAEDDEYVSEERFDKIRYYLKTGTYPNGSDRAEKSRLRSAATHYRLVPNTSGDGGNEEILMLKGKEVISDPHKQYEIARRMHAESHGGINKTTASIAEKYHWVRIKETVSAAIRNCTSCKDMPVGGLGSSGGGGGAKSSSQKRASRSNNSNVNDTAAGNNSARNTRSSNASHSLLSDPDLTSHELRPQQQHVMAGADPTPMSHHQQQQQHHDHDMEMHYDPTTDYAGLPVDPQLMMHNWQQQQHQQQEQQHLQHDASAHAQNLATAAAASNLLPTTNHQQQQHDSSEMENDAVTARLREELEAQMMTGGVGVGVGVDVGGLVPGPAGVAPGDGSGGAGVPGADLGGGMGGGQHHHR